MSQASWESSKSNVIWYSERAANKADKLRNGLKLKDIPKRNSLFIQADSVMISPSTGRKSNKLQKQRERPNPN